MLLINVLKIKYIYFPNRYEIGYIDSLIKKSKKIQIKIDNKFEK